MIDLYTSPTGNGLRAAVALAESGLPHKIHKLDMPKGEHKTPDYLKINPAGAIPAIVDADGPGDKPQIVTQSGAILLYVAEKTGKFMPKDPAKRAAALQWFMQAATDVQPAGSALFALNNAAPEKSPANVAFFETRLVNALKVADQRLAGREFLADEFSIADLALYPGIAARKPIIEKAGLTNLLSWMDRMAARPAVQKGMQLQG
jgi:GST-like protein